MIVYYLADEVYVMLQVFCNIYLSLLFLMYLAAFQPFIERETQLVNFFNEFCYYISSVLYLTFTDYNPDAFAKVFMGWILIVVVLGNLCFPNGYYMIRGMWPDIKNMCCSRNKNEVKDRRLLVKQLDDKRRLFIALNPKKIKLKPEYQEKEEGFDLDNSLPRKNQIVPKSFYPEMSDHYNFFLEKKKRHEARKQIKSMVPVIPDDQIKSVPHLESIEEFGSDQEKDSLDVIESKMVDFINQFKQ